MEIQKQRWSRVFAGWNMKTRGDEENKKKSKMGGGGGPEGRELVECREGGGSGWLQPNETF